MVDIEYRPDISEILNSNTEAKICESDLMVPDSCTGDQKSHHPMLSKINVKSDNTR